MQATELQTLVRPDSLAHDRTTQMGWAPIDQLPRLASVIEGGEGLEFTLQYGQDPEGVYIDSLVKGECQLLCQFCLSDYTQTLSSKARFRPVLTLESAREIPSDDEPVLYENGFINIINMIEDDALLALPTYPRCNDCLNENTFSPQFDILTNLESVPDNH